MATRYINELIGLTMVSVTDNVNEMRFVTDNGRVFIFYHDQDCSETVEIDDITGDLSDLVGEPILMAEEVTNRDLPPKYGYMDRHLWTFYKFATRKGYVDVRWFGYSNGYYSEEVFFKELT